VSGSAFSRRASASPSPSDRRHVQHDDIGSARHNGVEHAYSRRSATNDMAAHPEQVADQLEIRRVVIDDQDLHRASLGYFTRIAWQEGLHLLHEIARIDRLGDVSGAACQQRLRSSPFMAKAVSATTGTFFSLSSASVGA